MSSRRKTPVSPSICIELSIGQGVTEKVFMFEGEDPERVVDSICAKHGLSGEAREKLAAVIKSQLRELFNNA